MQKRQAIALYIIILVVLAYIGFGIGVFSDYQICEFFPNFTTCEPKIIGNKSYGYIYQEEIALASILILGLIFSMIYWKIIKKKIK